MSRSNSRPTARCEGEARRARLSLENEGSNGAAILVGDAPTTNAKPGNAVHLVRRLTLFDSIMLVVTGTIGPSIFIVPADVMRAIPIPAVALALWVVAGGITLMAGLACAELGAMFPEAGGQYVFMREAYGGFTAFLYGWVLFTAGNSAALASMGIAVALFLGQAVPTLAADHVLWADTIFGVHLKLEQGSVIAAASRHRAYRNQSAQREGRRVDSQFGGARLPRRGRRDCRDRVRLGPRIMVSFPVGSTERGRLDHRRRGRCRDDPAVL